jgi:hypothetical protein
MALSDTFTGSSGTDLSAHTADSGHTWSKISGDATHKFELSGAGQLRSAGSTGAEYTSNYDPGSADYYVEVDLDHRTDVSVYYEVGIRAESDGDGYFFTVNDFTNVMDIVRKTSGASVETTLDTMALDRSDWTMRLEASGTTIRVLKNGVEVMSASDSTFSAKGLVWLGKFGAPGSTDGWAFSEVRADVLAGGTDATVDADADNAVADGVKAALTHTVTASSEVTVPETANAVSTALVHTVSGGTNQTVTVPAPALGVDGTIAPAVSAGVTITSPAATGLGQAPIAGNEVSAEVSCPVAQGNMSVLTHSVSGSGSTEQTSPTADAVPAALVHAVQAGASVTVPETANAVSVALVHTVTAEIGAIVTAVPALAVGFMSGPLVDDGVADDDPTYWVETIPSIPVLPDLGE